MKLKITDANFFAGVEWIFKLIDVNGSVVYIMDDPFYKKYKLKSPVTKHELDYYDVGLEIETKVENLGGRLTVVEIIRR